MTRPRDLARALRALGLRPPLPQAALWSDAPAPGRALPALLPAAIPAHPPVALGLGAAAPAPLDLDAVRAGRLWWPATLAGALAAEVLVDLRPAPSPAALLDLAEAQAPPGTRIAVLAAPGGPAARAARARGLAVLAGPEAADPEALALVIGPPGAALPHHAVLGGRRGLTPDGPADPGPWATRARFLDPWTGAPIPQAQGLDALAFLRAAAQANDRPVVTFGLSPWKRRCAAPFLTGPAGPPIHRGRPGPAVAAARRLGARLAVWGQREPPEGAGDLPLLRLEDGFVRSVGLGIRHAPPASLAVDAEGLYFDATRPTDFARLAREAAFPPALTARAALLRDRLIALKITKYNLARSDPLPQTDRPRLLVPGQVEGDASLRWGSPRLHRNADLLRAARARHPGAFLLYKPHPDVLTGLRPGAVPPEVLAACADAVATGASADACLDWADAVETMTSLMGFEALLRGKRVAVHGRPFYAGWGLTEDLDPDAPRGRGLSLDELTAAALILYPRYIDPGARLPAPPERVLDWLHGERAFVRTPRGRLREAWRGLASRVLNVVR